MRANTKPLGHASIPSPQSRAPSNGKYSMMPTTRPGLPNEAPPLFDRANEIPSAVVAEAVPMVLQVT
jgi:hypothetical protein